MREIKCKAWHEVENRDGSTCFVMSDPVNAQEMCWCGEKNITLLEFTWLYDKNWKEVCEWDILETDDPEDDSRCDIVFKDGAFKKHYVLDNESVKDGDDKECYTYWDGVDSEIWIVIGNIYENEDLLK